MAQNDTNIKHLDEMGRIAIPREMRNLLGVKEGEQVELGIDGNKVTIQKYTPLTTLKEWSDCIISAILSVLEYEIVITDTEKVINASKKKYVNKNLTGAIQEMLYKREIVAKKQAEDSSLLEIFSNEANENICELVVPIIKDNDLLGGIILFSQTRTFDDDAVKVCKAFANLLNCLIV